MALLASKSQYAHIAPSYGSALYHPTGASPTSSEFSEQYPASDDVRQWDENKVGEWLATMNCGQYESIFRKNNITGDTLLDVDQAILKQLGITKVGDRVRIYAGIKNLRNRVSNSVAKKGNRRTLLALDSIATIPTLSPSFEAPRQQSLSSLSPGLPRNGYSAAEDSPNDDNFRSRNNQADSATARAPYKYASSTPSSTTGTVRSSVPTSDPVKVSALPSTATAVANGRQHQRAQPSFDGGIMSMENVKQNCVKFIGSEGSTRIVTISGAKTTDLILRKALKKFGLLEEDPMNWSVYVTADNSTRFLSDAELVRICHDISRPERERLILRPRKNGKPSPPTIAEFKRAQEIAKEQAEHQKQQQQQNQTVGAEISGSRIKAEQFFGEKVKQDGVRASRLDVPQISSSPRPVSPTPSNFSEMESGTSRRLKDFFGARPPSEMISSNLSEYFPDQDSKVLQRTVRNSIRRSRRLSKMSRMSTATTMSFADSFRDAPPVPTVADAWLGTGIESGNKKKRPISKRLHSNYSDDRSSLDMLEEEVLTPRLPKHQTLEPIDLSSSLNAAVSGGNDDAKSFLDESETMSIAGTEVEEPEEEEEEEGEEEEEEEEDEEEEGEQAIIPQKNMFASPAQHHNLLMQLLNFDDTDEAEEEDDDEGGTAKPASMLSGDSTLVSSSKEGTLTNVKEDEEDEDEDEYEEDEDEDEDEDEEEAGDEGNYHVSTNGMRWIKGALIGQGSFGSVYLALDAMSGILMAVKQVPSTGVHGEARKKSMMDSLEREIALLKDMQHENIVQYLGSDSEDDCLNIFLEYVPGGSVAAMLNQYGPLPEPLIKNFVRQILAGLNYLHNRDIIHRDIKGANVLVDNKGGIKISDFGISKKVESGLMSQAMSHRASMQGSVFWMAPEVVKQTAYTRKADIWSLGCLIVEMFTGDHPFPDCSQFQAIFKIGSMTTTPTIPSKCSAEAKTFLERAFEIDHHKRPTAEELLGFPFMKA